MEQTSQAFSNHRLDRRRPTQGKPKISCHRGTMWLGKNLGVSLINASEGGLALVVTEAMSRGQMVTLTVEGRSHPRPVKLSGKITWCAPQADGTFQVGVELEKRLSGQDLMRLT
jgi:PilZ domain